MNNIPVYVKPHPGELMYSWVARLAKANGLSLRAFYNAYLGRIKRDNGDLIYDLRTVFFPLCQRIAVPFDPMELYLSVTTLPFESVRASRYYVERNVNNSFQPGGSLNTRVLPLFRKAYVCPKCMEEDIRQYGEAYLHSAHHLSGVCVCHRHKIPLLEYKGTSRRLKKPRKDSKNPNPPVPRSHTMDFYMDDFEEVEVKPALGSAVLYAEYANEILEAKVVTDVMKVSFVISERMEELGLDEGSLISALKQWEHVSLFDGFDNIHLPYRKNLNGIEPFLLLMFLYPDPADAISAIKEKGTNLKEYVCPDCGAAYCSATPERWPCPECTSHMSEQEIFEILISAAGNGEYVPLTPFLSMNSKVELFDKVTGKKITVLPRNFLFRGTRPGRNPSYCNQLKWDRWFELYLRYVAETGNIYVPSECVYGGRRLGLWFSMQRQKERLGEIPSDRKEKLESAVSDFFSDDIVPKHSESPKYKNNSDAAWEKMYESMLRYMEKHETCRVPVEEAFEGHRLGYWVTNQRYSGRKGILPPEREQKLLEADPEFFSRDAVFRRLHEENEEEARAWNYKCELYGNLVYETGSFYVQCDTVYEGVCIGTWILTQRQIEKKGGLLPERKERLLSIDPDFFSRDVIRRRSMENREHDMLDQWWHQYFDAYREYTAEKGDPYIAARDTYHGMNLGKWVFHQREYDKKGTLLPERREMLLEIDPDFFSTEVVRQRGKAHRVNKSFDLRWEQKLEMYKQCVEEKEDLYIRSDEIYHGVQIGPWASHQRRHKKKGSLPPERIQKLLEIDPDFFNEKVLHERMAKHWRDNRKSKE